MKKQSNVRHEPGYQGVGPTGHENYGRPDRGAHSAAIKIANKGMSKVGKKKQ